MLILLIFLAELAAAILAFIFREHVSYLLHRQYPVDNIPAVQLMSAWLACVVADQRILHQGAEETLSGLQQHRRLHLHMECHHVYRKATAHMTNSLLTEAFTIPSPPPSVETRRFAAWHQGSIFYR